MSFKFDDKYNQELECAICLCPFELPVELHPCNHIFCRMCVDSMHECPECRQKITSREAPNRILVNMVLQLNGSCSKCKAWKGTKEQFELHHRSECKGSRQILSPSSPPSSIPDERPRNEIGELLTRQRTSQILSQQDDPFSSVNVWDEYGLTQVEYDEIAAAFLQFSGDGEAIDSSEFKKVALWINAPCLENDIRKAFLSFNETVESGNLTKHQFCVWFKTARRDPSKHYGLDTHVYLSVLSYFHSLGWSATEESFLLGRDSAANIATLVLGRNIQDTEINGFMRGAPKVGLHQLLTCLEDSKDGWEVCEVENFGGELQGRQRERSKTIKDSVMNLLRRIRSDKATNDNRGPSQPIRADAPTPLPHHRSPHTGQMPTISPGNRSHVVSTTTIGYQPVDPPPPVTYGGGSYRSSTTSYPTYL